MTIDMNDFLTIVNNSSSTLNIIDIRSKYIYDLSHINNSINVPYDYLLLSPSKYLNKELTRISQIYGYNETLEILKNIGLSGAE